MPTIKASVALVVSICNPEHRAHFDTLVPSLANGICDSRLEASVSVTDLKDVKSPAKVLNETLRLLPAGPDGMVVLLADWLVEDGHPWNLAPAVRDWIVKCRNAPMAAVAIMPHPRRIGDIDRTVSADCTSKRLSDALALVIERLEYLRAPGRRESTEPVTAQVRPLRKNNTTEFGEYFKLRHRVYSVMGYLEEEVEECTCRYEINEADTHALHFGAFNRGQFRETLVGCARVVLNTSEDISLRRVCQDLAAGDRVITERLNTAAGLSLPIFQSHSGMNGIMREVYRNNQICGELSRVIVDRDSRGGGLSGQLIGEALKRAVALGAERIFLECLEVHAPLYERFGFARLEGVVGLVSVVGRTMIAMEMTRSAVGALRPALGKRPAKGPR